jgi:hypothetical protein
MKPDLKLCLHVGVGLVDRVAFPASRGRNRTFSVGILKRQLVPLRE